MYFKCANQKHFLINAFVRMCSKYQSNDYVVNVHSDFQFSIETQVISGGTTLTNQLNEVVKTAILSDKISQL